MSGPVRSKQLALFAGTAPLTGLLLYTCPSTKRCLVKAVGLVAAGPVAATHTLIIKKGAPSTNIDIVSTPNAGGAAHFQGGVMLEPLDELRLTSSGGGVISGVASGIEFTLP